MHGVGSSSSLSVAGCNRSQIACGRCGCRVQSRHSSNSSVQSAAQMPLYSPTRVQGWICRAHTSACHLSGAQRVVFFMYNSWPSTRTNPRCCNITRSSRAAASCAAEQLRNRCVGRLLKLLQKLRPLQPSSQGASTLSMQRFNSTSAGCSRHSVSKLTLLAQSLPKIWAQRRRHLWLLAFSQHCRLAASMPNLLFSSLDWLPPAPPCEDSSRRRCACPPAMTVRKHCQKALPKVKGWPQPASRRAKITSLRSVCCLCDLADCSTCLQVRRQISSWLYSQQGKSGKESFWWVFKYNIYNGLHFSTSSGGVISVWLLMHCSTSVFRSPHATSTVLLSELLLPVSFGGSKTPRQACKEEVDETGSRWLKGFTKT